MGEASHGLLMASRGRRRRGSRGWRSWRWLALVLAVTTLGFALGALREGVLASEFARIETARARLDRGPGWIDERWVDELRWLLAEGPDIAAEDRAGIEDLAGRVAGLSFVESVGEARVLWPDGLQLELSLREPVACIHVGRHFLGVAADGTVLSGRWPSPPRRDAGFLPVLALGPAEAGPALARRIPGSRLDDPAAIDGLAVAVALWRDLPAEDQARLGRCKIDARRARFASVEEPGTRLLLEGRRTVLFGRSPNQGEPGELPVALKWQHVSRALRLLEPDDTRAEAREGLDWDQLDARWDEADLHLREGSPAAPGEGL